MKKSSLLAVVGALLLSACSTTSTSSSPSAPAVTFPLTLQNNNTSVTIPAEPKAIVSLSPTATEMLFAIGAGDQVIAVDDQSTYPAEAPKSDLSGFTPNLEAIVAKKPDLVVVSNDIDGIVASLTAASIPVLVEPAATSLSDTYTQTVQLGAATGNAAEAAALVTTMTSEIAKAKDSVKAIRNQSVYHELDNTMYTVTSTTFVGSIYKEFGLTNIADASPDASSGYPQLSAEYIVKANPSLIFLADTKCCSVTAETLAKRPGFATLSAVTSGNVFALDDDIASRWGPRTVQLYKSIADALNKVANQ